MMLRNIFYPADEEGPKQPIRDILAFEKRIKKSYNKESRRRIMYFVILVNTVIAYILYVSKQIFDAVWKIKSTSSIEVSSLILKIYLKMLGIIVLIFYIFIRLLRRSAKVSNALSNQLKLLNISFVNQKITLCQIRTPDNIKKSLQLFREEEQNRRVLWLKKE